MLENIQLDGSKQKQVQDIMALEDYHEYCLLNNPIYHAEQFVCTNS